MEATVILVGVLLLGVLLYFLVSDPISFLLFGILIAILFFVLFYYGFITIKTKTNELDINYAPTPPMPSGSGDSHHHSPSSTPTAVLDEVFYVGDNIFSYDQAPAVCKAYGAELASYSQVENAYNKGAEWCGYGWSSGGIALFPTQESTWRKLQLEVDPAKRIACGRPGINGGYFDPATKFGVNCYGQRPKHKKGVNDTDKAFAAAVARIKGMINKFSVYPFSQKEWSEYQPITDAEASIKGMGSDISKRMSKWGATAKAEANSAATETEQTIQSGWNGVQTGANNAYTYVKNLF
jgi:hypothetical protein